MVNYKLGALVGSSCDTIVSGIANEPALNQQLQISPNPASTETQITISDNQQGLLAIYNHLGQLVVSLPLNKTVRMNVSNFEPGVYQVVLNNTNGKRLTNRLTVVK
jgi:hypothetical protein